MQYTGPVQFRLFRFNNRDSYSSYFTDEKNFLRGTIPDDNIGKREYRSIINILNREMDSLVLRLDHTSEIRGVLFLFSNLSEGPTDPAESMLSDKIYIREIDFDTIYNILLPYAIDTFAIARSDTFPRRFQ